MPIARSSWSLSRWSNRVGVALVLAASPAVAADLPVLTVRGYVVDPSGAPVPGAKVRYAPDREARDSWLEATTDATGAYSIETPRAGAQGRLEVEHEGFATTRIDKTPPLSPLLALPSVMLLRPVELSGLVTGANGKALAGATVRALLESDELRLDVAAHVAASTAEAGTYSLPDLPPARLRIEVSAPGHRSYTEWLDLRGAGENHPFDFVLAPAPALRGRIVDSAGAPLAGVQVERAAVGPTVHETATTGADGRFELSAGFDAGEFLTLRQRGKARFRVAAGDFAKGDVVHPDGHPLRCAVATTSDSASPIVSVHYDVFTKHGDGWKHDDGVLTIDDAIVDAAGAWRVAVPHGDRARIRVRTADGRDSTPVELDLATKLPDGFHIDATMPPTVRVTGSVVGPTGQPVPGVRVEIGQPNEASLLPRATRATVTDATGAFAFDGVAPGSWSVLAASTEAISQPQLLGIAAGQVPPPIALTAAIASRVAGKVTVNGKAPGRPLAVVGMRYQRVGAGGMHVAGVATFAEPDGAYSLAPLARGAYVVAAFRPPEAVDGAWHDYSEWVSELDVKNSPNRVTALDTSESKLDLPLEFQPRGTVRGLVKVNGIPRGAARIAIQRKATRVVATPVVGDSQTLLTDSKGCFRAVLGGAGTYEIALVDGALRASTTLEYEAGTDRDVDVAVAAGAVAGRFAPQATTDGIVRAVLESPITPEEDAVRRANPSNLDDTPWVSRAEVAIEADGSYRFPEIAAGTYRVAFEDLSRALARVASAPFELAGGKVATVPDLPIPPATSLVLVLEKDAAVAERFPFASAKVVAADGSPPLSRTFVGWFVGSEAKVDGLPPGRVTVELVVFGKWKRPAAQTIEIAPGTTPKLAFTVEPMQ